VKLRLFVDVQTAMPPIGDARDLRSLIQEHIDNNKVVMFSKSYCPYCKKVRYFILYHVNLYIELNNVPCSNLVSLLFAYK